MKLESVAIIIPAYNEEYYLPDLLERLKTYKKQAIIVDDGSTDKTFDIACKNGFTVLHHLVNLGKGAALKTGCEFVLKKGGEYIIFMDADSQHCVDDMGNFIRALEKNQFVIGQRRINLDIPLIRFLGNKLTSFFFNLLFRAHIEDPLSGFRAFKTDIYSRIRWESSGYEVEVEMLVRAIKNKVKITKIPIETIYIDRYKGVTILSAYKILFSMLKWRLNL